MSGQGSIDHIEMREMTDAEIAEYRADIRRGIEEDKLIERVAKAMAEELDDLDVRGLYIAARAAIAAMREPTTEKATK